MENQTTDTEYKFVLSVEEEAVSYFTLTKTTDNEDMTDFNISIEDGIIQDVDYSIFEEVVIGLHDGISLANDFDTLNNINFTITKCNIVC